MAHTVILIYTEERRGCGVEGDINRCVPQLWTTDGKLVCAYDFMADNPELKVPVIDPGALFDLRKVGE